MKKSFVHLKMISFISSFLIFFASSPKYCFAFSSLKLSSKNITSSKFETFPKYISAFSSYRLYSQIAMFRTYLASPCLVSEKMGLANSFILCFVAFVKLVLYVSVSYFPTNSVRSTCIMSSSLKPRNSLKKSITMFLTFYIDLYYASIA